MEKNLNFFFRNKKKIKHLIFATLSVYGLLFSYAAFAQQDNTEGFKASFANPNGHSNRDSVSPLQTGSDSAEANHSQNSTTITISPDVLESFSSANSDSNYDPISVNGKYFENWETPHLALIFTGRLDGYVEPCGCAGIAQMKGGLSRRGTFFHELEAKHWPLVSIDTGGFVNGFGRQEELKYSSMITPSIVQEMKYDAVGIGPNDLRLPAEVLLANTTNTPENPSVFTSANIGVFGFDPMCTAPYRVIDKHGVRIGVTSVVGKSWQVGINNADVEMKAPIPRLKTIVPQMENEHCRWLILISHASMEETLEIAKTFPQFGIVVCADTPSEPPMTPTLTTNNDPAQYLIEVGEKGKFGIVLGFFGEDFQKIAYQRVAFDSRYINNQNIVDTMQIYQENLKMELDTKGFAGFGIRPVTASHAEILGKYVGSEKCKSCHDESYRVWQQSGHAKAWESLEKTSIPPRTYDPECVCCHVVGWNTTEKYPYISGFSNELEKMTLDLAHVGCESCHGPGEKHCAVEIGHPEAEQERLRTAMRLTITEAKRMCYTCHDLDNSPAFDFNKYWSKIAH
ncbi:MAG: hypothetical protein LBJ67_13825 [Planctomycetaceae bacterium]|jgi:hypothetical protein|nr:hypothetical protein [Planctomycetaceae bacterium]